MLRRSRSSSGTARNPLTAFARALGVAALLGLLAAALAAPSARAAEALPSHPFLFSLEGEVREPGHIPVPPPEGEFEDACGVAVDSAGDIYISDYYHRVIYVYNSAREYMTQIKDPDPDGPCNLAVDSSGDVYVNNWHRNVVRYAPSSYPPTESTRYGSETTIDFPSAAGARSTGVFLDPATGNLYVDDRTYVAEYKAPIEPGALPAAKIGLGTLGQGYGVAVSDSGATAGDVYVPDAASNTVKVYKPSTSLITPVQAIDGAGTPQHGFRSLADSDVAIDQTDGHLFVADNTEPGFERPAAAIDEFNAAGDYRGQLPGSFVDAEPTALALDGAGKVYATSGNTEAASLDAFGPTVAAASLAVAKTGAGEGTVTSDPAGIDCGAACKAEYNAGSEVTLTAVPAPGSEFAGWSGGGCSLSRICHLTVVGNVEVSAEFEALPAPLLAPAEPGGTAGATTTLGVPARGAAFAPSPAAASEIVQRGNLRVSVAGKLSPKALPRRGAAPIAVSIGSRITTTDGSNPPQLRTIAIAINRNGRFDYKGLPACQIKQIQPSTNQGALAACRASLIGAGSFSANVVLPRQSPFPSNGKVLAFNGTLNGRPAILAHVYGTEPVPTSYTLPFLVKPLRGGTFGTLLTASLPQTTGEWGFVTGIQLTLKRTFTFRGVRHSYLSAGCPAPRGFPGAVFALAKASFAFAGHETLSQTLMRDCRARG
jgi:Divergent InlB B-repeat domain